MLAGKRSKLKFKGDDSNKLTGIKKKKISEEGDDIDKITSSSSTKAGSTTATEAESHNANNFEPQQGMGRITSSGTIIQGHYTKFMDEVTPGDAIMIMHPTTFVEEMKIVRIVVSNTSMSISSAFSSDLISTTPFRYIRAPKEAKSTKASGGDDAARAVSNEDKSNGTYASEGGEKFVYRVKKTGSFGGYKIVTENTTAKTDREVLLDMRSKKKSDRFCH